MRPLKSWFAWNQILIVQKSDSGRASRSVADERPPTPDELRTMLHASDLRAKTSIAIIAFSGVRIEVLGDFLEMTAEGQGHLGFRLKRRAGVSTTPP